MTLAHNLAWSRFWVSDESSEFASSDGFLYPLDEMTSAFSDRLPKKLEDLRNVPVLILLGEAGMGKTDTLCRECDALNEQPNTNSQFLDLRDFGDEVSLRHQIREILTSVQGVSTTILHIDSFDECRLEIGHLARLLLNELSRATEQIDFIKIRIASRSTEWPLTFTKGLQHLYKEADVQEWWLCPLRRIDAAKAADAIDVDSSNFLREIDEKELESLACRPKTLGYLLSEYSENGSLPKRRWQLFDDSILHLCQESIDRIDSDHGGTLTAQQRMAIAGRLAATMVLCNKAGFVPPGRSAHAEPENIALEDLVYPEESFGGFAVTLESIRETLRIGALFDTAPNGILRFSHRSDAEFLAAWYLDQLLLPEHVKRSLLQDPHGQWLPPQLYGVAAWLAENNESIQEWLLANYPLVILASEISLSPEQRANLVSSLISMIEDGVNPNEIPPHRLKRLCYSEICDQLGPIIDHSSAGLSVRYFAFQTIEACEKEEEVVDQLRNVLDCSTEYEGPKANAAILLANLAQGDNKSAIEALRPLALGDYENDREERLRGIALEVLWPSHISAKEIFSDLNVAKGDNILNRMDLFLEKLGTTLTSEDLPLALTWAKTQIDKDGPLTLAGRRLIDSIMVSAYKSLDDPEIFDAFCTTALAALKKHESLFNRSGGPDSVETSELADDGKRRKLVAGLLGRVSESESGYFRIGLILRDSDIPWLIEFMGDLDRPRRKLAARLVGWQYRPLKNVQTDELILEHAGPCASDPLPELQEALNPVLGGIELDSDVAVSLREQLSHDIEREKRQKHKQEIPPRQALLSSALQRCTENDPGGWVQVVRALSADLESGTWGSPSSSIIDSAGWQELTEDQRSKVVRAADKFLSMNLPTRDFFCNHQEPWTYGDAAAYAAFSLLIDIGESINISDEVILIWTPFLVWHHPGQDQASPNRQRLLHFLSEADKPHFLSSVIAILKSELIANTRGSWRIRELTGIWSEELADALVELAFDPELPSEGSYEIKRLLARHLNEKIISSLCGSVQTAEDRHERAEAAAILLSEATDRAWETVAPILMRGDQETRDLIAAFNRHLTESSRIWANLSEAQAAQLFIALERQFPISEERRPGGPAFTPTLADDVAQLKRGLLGKLQIWGTDDAVKAVDLLCEEFPEYEWLKRARLEAEDQAKTVAWRAPRVKELLAQFRDIQRSLVRSDAELMNLALQSLDRLNSRLQGETPMSLLLWNSDRTIHRSEDRISDFIKYHLQMDLADHGLAINREVQIRNLNESGIGERSDILVQALGNAKKVASVVIEVKGDWHDQLEEAIKTQLHERYLKFADYNCGIYLILWTGSHGEKVGTLEEVKERFEDKAHELSIGEKTIRGMVVDISPSR